MKQKNSVPQRDPSNNRSESSGNCVCGLSYLRNDTGDARKHRKVHAEYADGPRIVGIVHARELTRGDEFSIRTVNAQTPSKIRTKVAHVAMIAARETGFPASYDGSNGDSTLQMFVAEADAKVVSMAITRMEAKATLWKLGWRGDGMLKQLERDPIRSDLPTVSRVWTAANYRRRGLAVRLLQEIVRHFRITSEFAWALPFTRSGLALVHQVCPEIVWGCGDEYALGTAIHAGCD